MSLTPIHEGFEGATGNKSQVDSLTGHLGVPYSIDLHDPGDTEYLVGHSGAVYLISPEATLAAIYQPPHTAQMLTERLEQIKSFMNRG